MKNIPLYTAIGLLEISLAAHAARAEDRSTVTALLSPGTFTTSAHSDDWKIANALSAAPATVAEVPYITRLNSSVDATSVWVVPVANGGDRIEEEPRK